MPAWSTATWAERESLIQQFVGLLAGLRNLLNTRGARVEFSVAIAWWFNERAAAGNIPSADATNLRLYADVLVPMAFFDTPAPSDALARIIGRTRDEVTEAPAIVGINASEFATYADIVGIIGGVTNALVGNANYQGTSIFNFGSLRSQARRSHREPAPTG